MIKRSISLCIAVCAVTSALSQTTPVPGYQTYPANLNANQSGMGGITFSNRAGRTFTPDELAAQLRNLRTAVDQSLPILSALNETYSNSVNGGRQTVGGALSGIVSDVLHRNQTPVQNSTSQSGFGASNLMAILHGLLNTNSSGAVGAAPSNAQDLLALENALQPVLTILERLNVSGDASVNAPYGTITQPYPNGGLSPTGPQTYPNRAYPNTYPNGASPNGAYPNGGYQNNAYPNGSNPNGAYPNAGGTPIAR